MSADVACAMFLLCENQAQGTVEIGVLGHVPTCRRCAERLGFTLQPGYFMFAPGPVAVFHPDAAEDDGPCQAEWHALRRVKRADHCPACNEANR